MRVFVTDASYKNALASIRDLQKSGHDVHTGGRSMSISRFSRHVSHFHTTRNQEELSRTLLALADDQIDCILPVGAASVFLIDSLRKELEGRVAFAIGPERSMNIARDKFELQKFGESVGVASPKSWRFSDPRALRTMMPELPLPFVIKSVSHLDSSGPLYIRSEDERQIFIQSEALNPSFLFGDVEVQEYIEGGGEGFFALYQEGECKRLMMHQRLGETPATGGSSWAAKSIFRKDLDSSGRKLLDSLQWHGPAMVEFKRRKSDGRLFLMELNPKLWGSLDLTIASGFRVPSETVRVARGENLRQDFSFAQDIYFWWPLDSWDAFFGRRKVGASKTLTNVSLNDLGPSIVALVVLATRSLMRRLRGHWWVRSLSWWRKGGLSYALSRIWGELFGMPSKRACEVTPSLWIGAKPSFLGNFLLKYLYKRKRYSLLDETQKRAPKYAGPEGRGTYIPEFVEISLQNLTKALGEISTLTSNHQKLYVHCREGVGRAPTLAAASLMLGGRTRQEAIDMVESKRKVANINHLQKESLKEYETFLGRKRSL